MTPMRTTAAVAPGSDEREPTEQRRVIRTLVVAQVLSGVGLAAGVTVGAVLAQRLLGSDSLAGVPAALFTAGSATAAVLVGRISNSQGRRRGLAIGYAAGAAGAAAVVMAASLGWVVLLLAALLLYGAGTATNLQARYAGADLAQPDRRGRAVSTVLVATTVGAVIGPNLVSVSGKGAAALGLPLLAGPFLVASVAYGLAGMVLVAWLRPDPLLLARAREGPVQPALRPDGDVHNVKGRVARPVIAGTLVMVVAQLIMVAVMTMTPIHMLRHGQSLGAAGAVIAAHIAGMYLPSPISGRLVDRIGARPVAVASGITLMLAGLLAAAVPSESIVGLGVALTVLGIGWNLGLLSGTTLVTNAVPVNVRAKTQGAVDLCVALAGAGGGLGSGLFVAATSFATLGVTGALVALAAIPIVTISTRRQVA